MTFKAGDWVRIKPSYDLKTIKGWAEQEGIMVSWHMLRQASRQPMKVTRDSYVCNAVNTVDIETRGTIWSAGHPKFAVVVLERVSALELLALADHDAQDLLA